MKGVIIRTKDGYKCGVVISVELLEKMDGYSLLGTFIGEKGKYVIADGIDLDICVSIINKFMEKLSCSSECEGVLDLFDEYRVIKTSQFTS